MNDLRKSCCTVSIDFIASSPNGDYTTDAYSSLGLTSDTKRVFKKVTRLEMIAAFGDETAIQSPQYES